MSSSGHDQTGEGDADACGATEPDRDGWLRMRGTLEEVTVRQARMEAALVDLVATVGDIAAQLRDSSGGSGNTLLNPTNPTNPQNHQQPWAPPGHKSESVGEAERPAAAQP